MSRSNSSSTILIFTDQAIVSAVNFIMSILLARHLGLDEFGNFSLLMMIILFIGTINNAVIIQPMLSFKSEVTYHANILALQLIFSFISYFVVIIGMMIFDEFTYGDMARFAFYVALLVFFTTLQECVRRMLFVKKLTRQALIIDGINYLGKLIAVLWFVINGNYSLNYIFAMFSLVSMFSILTGYYFINRFLLIKATNLSVTIREHVSFSSWLVASAMMQWFAGNAFVIAGAVIIGPSMVAIVRVVQNLMGLAHVVLLAMENFVPMRAARYWMEGGWVVLRKYIIRFSIVNISIVSSLFLVVYLFGNDILLLLYGDNYVSYESFFKIYVLTYFFVAINAMLKILFRTIRVTKTIFFADAASVIFSLLIAYPVIEKFREMGFLIGTIAASSLVTLVLLSGAFVMNRKYRVGV